MDDFGNSILMDYVPPKEYYKQFNWTAYVYYMLPEYASVKWI